MAKDAIENSLYLERMLQAAIVESSDDAIIAKTLDGTVTSWNVGAERIFGYSADEMIGKSILAITPRERHAEEMHLIAAVTRGEPVKHFETQRIRKDGRPIDVSVTVSPIRDKNGRIIGASKIARDITDIKESEQALAASEERFRATFEQAAVGIAHVAPDGRWLRVNRKLCDIVGYTREELLGLGFQDITHPDDLDADLAQVRQVLAGEIDAYSMEKRYLRKDGGQVWINLTVALVRDAHGAPDYFISVVEEIEARKQAEEEIRYLNTGLERRVEERTAELKAANQELDSFAYAVSHDLRAPLRAMGGFSQALLEDYGPTLPEEGQRYLDEIGTASRKMGALIDGLLQLSRSTRGELRRDSIDLSGMAGSIRDELERQEPGRRVAWQIEEGLAAHGDARTITAVMQNLIGNAWKYTAATDKPLVRIFAEQDGAMRWFRIADNGAGFDMRHAEKLFKPFQRLHRQDEFPGIGIGLATVQRIIHRHGGDIRAEGRIGEGATFSFTLPDGSPEVTA